MKNNLKLTLWISILCILLSFWSFTWTWWGMIVGILYAQVIEWFVHGWIQHHPFKIFKPYRDNHTYHHKYPNEPLSVQPIGYFLIGSVPLLIPMYFIPGAISGYFIAYWFINVIHNDLHSRERLLPDFIWNSSYFRLVESNHINHHKNQDVGHTTFSVTNPYIDVLFSKIKLSNLNNWVARNLKI